MGYEIIITPAFERAAKPLLKKYHSLKDELIIFFNLLEMDPFQGKSLGKDCFKIRIAIKSKGRGKSGSARIITCVKIISEKVYLVSIFDKSEKNNITDNEIVELLKNL